MRLSDPSPEPKRTEPKSEKLKYLRALHSRIFKAALVVHVVSLLACVAATEALSYPSSSPPCQPLFPPKNETSPNGREDQCVVWHEEDSPRELCEVDTTTRVFRLRSTFLFPQLHPISLYEILAAGSKDRDIPSRLRPGVEGADCLRSDETRCKACFHRLGLGLRQLEEAYRSFDSALLRFDCLPAVDTASATRPFSPNGSCTTCRSWYRRWLLVHTVPIWKAPPCINWCYYAQLACPHIATSKVVDYAGHPSFQCRDLDIPSSREAVNSCECVHPCDLRGVVPQTGSPSTSSRHHRRTDHDVHDFYAADSHCRARERSCSTVRLTRGASPAIITSIPFVFVAVILS